MTAIAAALLAVAPGAWAADIPSYTGAAQFSTIKGPTDPEEFSWEVQLDAEQEMRQIDDLHVGVYYTGSEEVLAWAIAAELAHDAHGAAVPTTLSVTGPTVITLTVHHRAGNPAAGNSPFAYPVSAGQGYETGYATGTIEMPPPETVVVDPPLADPPLRRCNVPDLQGRSLKAARRLLKKASCKLGPVRGERARGAKVVRQLRMPGKSLPLGTEVGVKLG